MATGRLAPVGNYIVANAAIIALLPQERAMYLLFTPHLAILRRKSSGWEVVRNSMLVGKKMYPPQRDPMVDYTT